MYTLEQAIKMQEDFTYIIDKERRIGMETGNSQITLFFGHGGTICESYKDNSITATMPTDEKYISLKNKYFPNGDNLSIFYPYQFKKDLDKKLEG